MTAYGNKNIENCTNYGKITITGTRYAYGACGGMIGYSSDSITLMNCINEGEISGTRTGGMAGCMHRIQIMNCINKGKASGGMLYRPYASANIKIINCCNLGECKSGMVHFYSGSSNSGVLVLNIYNSFNLGKVSTAGAIGSHGTTCQSLETNINNFYNAGLSPKVILGGSTNNSKFTINFVNTYYDADTSNSVGSTPEGVTGKSTSEIKSQSFVDILNSNIGENTDWSRWKLGSDGYPTFDIE